MFEKRSKANLLEGSSKNGAEQVKQSPNRTSEQKQTMQKNEK